jgi:hypothetical protein
LDEKAQNTNIQENQKPCEDNGVMQFMGLFKMDFEVREKGEESRKWPMSMSAEEWMDKQTWG